MLYLINDQIYDRAVNTTIIILSNSSIAYVIDFVIIYLYNSLIDRSFNSLQLRRLNR